MIVSAGFLLASLVVVLIPGPGALYTVRTGLASGRAASMVAATACTAAVVPHLLAAAAGLAVLLRGNAVAFQSLRWAGIAYLLFIAWGTWRERRSVLIDTTPAGRSLSAPSAPGRVVREAFALNALNPKLTLFFVAFLPQFLPQHDGNAGRDMLALGAVFMAMTLAVFTGFGLAATALRPALGRRPEMMAQLNGGFAAVYLALATALAVGVM